MCYSENKDFSAVTILKLYLEVTESEKSYTDKYCERVYSLAEGSRKPKRSGINLKETIMCGDCGHDCGKNS